MTYKKVETVQNNVLRVTIGKSVQGRQLAGIVIGQGVRQGRSLLRPQVLLVVITLTSAICPFVDIWSRSS